MAKPNALSLGAGWTISLEKMVVIRDPKNPDGGTGFEFEEGVRLLRKFDDLRAPQNLL